MAKEHPIIFSGQMVRAILNGQKSQTRRVIKPQPEAWVSQAGYTMFTGKGEISFRGMTPNGPAEYTVMRKYNSGDRLWVRETWLPDAPIDGWDGCWEWDGCGRPISGVPKHYQKPENCVYAATWDGPALSWKPSIHMPQWACRIRLQITSIRVERVQQISYSDALAEGVWRPGPDADPDEVDRAYDAKVEFHRVWDEINAERGFGWDANPWVWVIEFEVVTTGINCGKQRLTIKHLFTDGTDTVIAEDEKGADAAWEWYTGDPHNTDCDHWKQIPDDQLYTVYFENEVKPEKLPDGAVQVFDDDDMLAPAEGYVWNVTAKASAWAASWDDDFLCSTEV